MPPAPESLLHVSVVTSAERAIVRLEGELDCASAPQFQAAIDALWAEAAPGRVVVEAEELSFMDVAGLRPLLDLHRRLPPGSLQVRNARRPIVRVLRLLNLAGELGIDG